MGRQAVDSAIAIKRVYDPPAAADGTRVLVDRLWPRGLSKETAELDLWLKEVAPSAELRTWFGHDPARWLEFGRRYRAELKDNDDAVGDLVSALGNGRITLLYGAKDTAHNQAVILADYLRDVVTKRRGHHAAHNKAGDAP